MESKILNVNIEKTLTKAEQTIQRAEIIMARSEILERDLLISKQLERDLQREIQIRQVREKNLGRILLLSNICWILIVITIMRSF